MSARGRPGSIIDVDDPLPGYDLRNLYPDSVLPAKRAGDYYMFDYDRERMSQPNRRQEFQRFESFLVSGVKIIQKLAAVHRNLQNLDLDSTMEAVAVAEKGRTRLEQAVEEDLGPVVRFRKTAGGGGRNGDDSPDRSETSSGKLETHICDEAKASSKSWPELILVVFKFGWKVIKSSLGWVASFLNARSREHRYVAFVLNKEKERLKQVMNDELYDAQRPAGELRRLGRIAMIFYTEVVIVIKFLFQFGFWYWNRQSAVIQETNEPYKLPYVLGIQKPTTLRYMLRRLGLWKDANVQDTFSSSTVSTTITEPQTRLESPQRTSIVSGTSRKGSASKQKTKRNSQDQEEIDMETGLGSSTIQPSTSQAAQSMYATKDVADDSNSNNGQEDHSSSGAVVVFFRKLLYPKFRYIRDLYPIMFFLDVLGFFIVAFGYKHLERVELVTCLVTFKRVEYQSLLW
uniref:Piezo transmembrane helical unit domain-containing protein n=1 Tax=Ditylenchus dipsaci TaxID=166011 RepID=A0A915ECZ7_9BILA